MCLSNVRRTCTNVMMEMNEQQYQYFMTELTEAMDNIEKHMQGVTIFAQQCCYLVTKLKNAVDNIAEHKQVQVVAAKEFQCVVSRACNLLKECSDENWLLKAVEMGDSGEHFVEVLLDLHLATDLVRWGSQKMELEGMLSSWKTRLEARRQAGIELCYCREDDKRNLLKRVNEEVFNSNRIKETERHLAYLLLHRHEPHFSWHPPDLETHVRNFKLTAWEKNVYAVGPMVVVKLPLMGRQFALKMPLPRVLHDSNQITHEAILLEKYENPNIVEFVGHWKIPVKQNYLRRLFYQSSFIGAKLVPLLLMECMEKTLRELLDECERGLSPLEVINLMLPVARALNYLHSKEVAHRDLKPQDIMCKLKHKLCEPRPLDGITVKLIDFGDAQELGAHASLQIAKAGTTGYMAPEVQNLTDNQIDDIDLLKADIFSFGMVLGEVLTKRPPLEALGSGNRTIFCNKLKEGERPNIPDHFPLKFITQSCWDGNPRHRPQAEDICRMLSHAKLFLSGNVFSTHELRKVFSFEDHDGVIRSACCIERIGGRGFLGGHEEQSL